mgnify:CR=1 FL=1
MPVPNPYQGTHYEHDPEMQQALRGTPAEPALTPSRKGTWKETLAQLASWMGMALPGRGGVGGPQMIRFPLVNKWGHQELQNLAIETPDLSWSFMRSRPLPRPITPKQFTMGRARPSDTVKPHRPIEQATVEGKPAIDLTALRKLLDVLWSHYEIPPKIHLP